MDKLQLPLLSGGMPIQSRPLSMVQYLDFVVTNLRFSKDLSKSSAMDTLAPRQERAPFVINELDMNEIKENAVYTAEETQKILKISSSTMMRLIKKGLINAAKLGGQYRILGKEILRAVSPRLEDQVGKLYNKGRKWIHEGVDETPKKGSK